MLEDMINQMLGDQHMKDRFYNHPLIKGLYTEHGTYKPGGIPSDKFALVLLDEVLDCGPQFQEAKTGVMGAKTAFEQLKRNVESLKVADGNTGLQSFATCLGALLIGIEDQLGDSSYAITKAQSRVEGWYNNAMERLSGAYRRRHRNYCMTIGIAIAVIFNVDTAALTNTLWRDSVTKQAIAAQASQLREPGSDAPVSTDAVIAYIDQSQGLSLPIGWSSRTIPTGINGWMTKIIGILFSGIMAAYTAPYWFDLMRKLVSRGVSTEPSKASG